MVSSEFPQLEVWSKNHSSSYGKSEHSVGSSSSKCVWNMNRNFWTRDRIELSFSGSSLVRFYFEFEKLVLTPFDSVKISSTWSGVDDKSKLHSQTIIDVTLQLIFVWINTNYYICVLELSLYYYWYISINNWLVELLWRENMLCYTKIN